MDINFKLENYVKKLGKRLGIDFAPKRAHDTDAGADLRTPHDFWVPAHDSVLVDLGMSVELPPNTCGELWSKSGLNCNSCITTTGLIDQGYTGTIKVRIYNHGNNAYHFRAGDKVTQLVVKDVCYPNYVEADTLLSGERGNAGFGSTGKR